MKRMLRKFILLTVLGMTGLAAACGRAYYRESPDAGVLPVQPVADAAPVDPPVDPVIDGAVPDGAPLDPGLIAWYPLDSVENGVTEDATGNGHHAACVPDPASCPALAEGRVDGAMQFDAMNHLRVANDGFFDTSDGFTIAAWVWLEEPFYSAPLSKMLGTGTGNSWQFEFAGDRRPAFTTANDSSKEVDYVDEPVEPATWVHLAGTWDGATKRFYVDGIQKLALPFVVSWDGSDFVIGGDENGGSPALGFGGRIDDVRIYDRVLTDGELAQLAQAASQTP